MPWESIKPNLINTLPASSSKNWVLNYLQADVFIVSCLAQEDDAKAILEFIIHSKYEVFHFLAAGHRAW